MKNRKRTALILAPVLLAGLATGGIAWGQQGEGRRGEGARIARAEGGEERGGHRWHGREGRRERRGHGQTLKRMARKLELTDDQVKKIRSVLTDARKKGIVLRAAARVARIELREMVSRETVDKAGIDAKVGEVTRIRGDLLRARTDAALAVREILTPEQMAKADKMLQHLLKGRRGRGHR